MKEYVIISGKGGTGKTSLTAAFAMFADNPIVCDADVDAADLHLLLKPKIRETYDFISGNQAIIDKAHCTDCGLCRELCRFDAISYEYVVDPINCEGCGVCVDLCPEKTIDFPAKKSGEWFISDTRVGPMVHARLGIAEENSGKLVSLIRRETRRIAEESGYNLLITDGPPGIGCPVIASLGGADAAIIIVEPTVSGVHDVHRVASLARNFGLIPMLCVNRFDINVEITEEIEQFCRDDGFTVLPRIPFDRAFTMAMVHGKTLPEYDGQSATSKKIKEVWDVILQTTTTKAVRPPMLHTLEK